MNHYLETRNEVADALADRLPVVALESTVISHGLPWPRNLETAQEMEKAVRKGGATPATIGVLKGRLVVGLSPEEIKLFAKASGVTKVSRRDVAAALATGRLGATTVAATMYISALAGVRVMATGGIGGVHRGGEKSFDISADLTELARTPLAVICSGAKAILDLPRTLEMLETLGVPVVGYRTNEFPSFYSRESGLPLEVCVETPEQAVQLMTAQWDSGLSAGIVFGNPPPADQALARADVETFIARAVDSAKIAGIRGKALTPYLLDIMAQVSNGRTLETNVALLLNNAYTAAKIAVAFSKRSRS